MMPENNASHNDSSINNTPCSRNDDTTNQGLVNASTGTPGSAAEVKVTCYRLLMLIGRHRLPLVVLNVGLLLSFFIPGFIYLTSFLSFLVAGCYASFLIYDHKQAFSNLLPGFLFTSAPEHRLPGRDPNSPGHLYDCGVCDKQSGPRHGDYKEFDDMQPWSDIDLPVSVDQALQEILELILKDFIYVWYSDLSEDESFVNELRGSLRYILAVVYHRLQQVDIADFIVYDIIDIAVKHLHTSLHVDMQIDTQMDAVDDEVRRLRDFSRRRHLALTSRPRELEYLRMLSRRLLLHILPRRAVQCKTLYDLLTEILSGVIILPLMDIIANPNIINKLLLLLFEDAQKLPLLEPEKTNIILTNFNKEQERISDLPNFFHGLTLPVIQRDTEMLFTFMQFLKREQSINILQCYLAIETINGRLLTPDLTAEDFAELHCELCELYRVHYSPCLPPLLDLSGPHDPASDTRKSSHHRHQLGSCTRTSTPRLRFHSEDVKSIMSFCEGPSSNMSALQTSTALFRSQDVAYDSLNVLIALFAQSDFYFKFKFGKRINPSGDRNRVKSPTNNKYISRLRNVAKSNNLSLDTGCTTADASSSVEPSSPPLSPPLSPPTSSPACIDMSLWKVGVDSVVERTTRSVDLVPPTFHQPHAHTAATTAAVGAGTSGNTPTLMGSGGHTAAPPIINSGVSTATARRYYTYTVRIRCQDKEWLTERLYNEFYVLEKKLNEFHGNLTTMKLPSRQTFGGKNNRDFLEKRIYIFQEYLNSLLSSSSLCRSELLYNFLSSNDEQFSSGPLLDIGKVTVKAALRPFIKEKGQNLDSFLSSFTKSTLSKGSRASSTEESIESDCISITSEHLSGSLFENNADIADDDLIIDQSDCCTEQLEMADTNGAYDAVLYLVQNVFTCHWAVTSILIGLRKLVRRTADLALSAYLSMKLRRVLRPDYSRKLIHLIRDAIFFDTDPPDTEDIIADRRSVAFKQLQDFIPGILIRIIGKENNKTGLKVIFDLLQKPKLNKQLSYVLLDRISIRLFPELV